MLSIKIKMSITTSDNVYPYCILKVFAYIQYELCAVTHWNSVDGGLTPNPVRARRLSSMHCVGLADALI